MRITPPRKLYKFSHSVMQGGYLYTHRTTRGNKISDKEKLRKELSELSNKFELIDVTIKIYDYIFFLFFMMKPKVEPQKLIVAVQEAILPYGQWDNGYVYTGVYDLQEAYIRKDLEQFGLNYDQG